MNGNEEIKLSEVKDNNHLEYQSQNQSQFAQHPEIDSKLNSTLKTKLENDLTKNFSQKSKLESGIKLNHLKEKSPDKGVKKLLNDKLSQLHKEKIIKSKEKRNKNNESSKPLSTIQSVNLKNNQLSKSKSKSKPKLSPTTKKPNLYTNAFGKAVSNHDLLNEFKYLIQKNIEKLKDTSTRNIGYQELKNLINSNQEESKIKVFVTLLTRNNKGFSNGAKEFQILLLSYLTKDRNNYFSKLENLKPLLNSFNNYNTEQNEIIQKTYAFSFIEIFKNYYFQIKENIKETKENCFNLIEIDYSEKSLYPNTKINTSDEKLAILFPQVITTFFSSILESINNYYEHHTNFSNKNGHNGELIEINDKTFIKAIYASSQLSEFSKFGISQSNILIDLILLSLYENIVKKFSILNKNTKIILPQLYESLSYQIEYFGIENLFKREEKYFKVMIDHIIDIIHINSSKIYTTKIQCCLLLNNIFTKLYKTKIKGDAYKFFTQSIFIKLKNALEFGCSDRVVDVQNISNLSLKFLIDLKENLEKENAFEKKTSTNFLTDLKESYDLNDKKTNHRLSKLNLIRKLTKTSKIGTGTFGQLGSITNDLIDEVYSKGFGALQKTKKFINNKHNSYSKENLRSKSSRTGDLRKFISQRQKTLLDMKNERELSLKKKQSNFVNRLESVEDEKEIDSLMNKTVKSSDLDINDNKIYYKTDNKKKLYVEKTISIEKKNKQTDFFVEEESIHGDNQEVEISSESIIESAEKINEEKESIKEETIGEKDLIKKVLTKGLNQFTSLTESFKNQINKRLNKLDKKIDHMNNILVDYQMKNEISNTLDYSNDIEMENPLLFNWIKVVRELNNKNFNEAYEILSNMDDDLYIIRFCYLINKLNIGNLSKDYCCHLIKRLLKIVGGEKLKILFCEIVNIVNLKFPNCFSDFNKKKKDFKDDKIARENHNKDEVEYSDISKHSVSSDQMSFEMSFKQKRPKTERSKNSKMSAFSTSTYYTENEVSNMLDILYEFSSRKDNIGVNCLKSYLQIISSIEENEKKYNKLKEPVKVRRHSRNKILN